MSLVAHYAAMARYNRWMNEKVYACADALGDEKRTRDLGAFFGSVHRTLNHLLLTDRIWLGRLGAGPAQAMTSLGDELHADFAELRRERLVTDDALERFVAGLDEDRLAGDVTYRTARGDSTHPLWFAVAQVFNHQTHHRGQITTLLRQLGEDVGTTDLIAMLRSEQAKPLPIP